MLAFTWSERDDAGAPLPSEVTFELAERGQEVRLVPTHRRLASDARGAPARRASKPFWSEFERLQADDRRRFKAEA